MRSFPILQENLLFNGPSNCFPDFGTSESVSNAAISRFFSFFLYFEETWQH